MNQRIDLKQLVDTGLASPLASRLVGPATRGSVTVFVLHRIAGMGAPHEGIDRELLAGTLDRLRRDGYRFVGLPELLAMTPSARQGLRRAVAFTADDGYHDQAEVLAPLLAEFDCPLTIFLTSGFLDGEIVPWWDRVGHAITSTTVPELEVSVGTTPVRLAIADDPVEALYTFLRVAKRAPNGDRLAAIADLVDASGVDVPQKPFGRFRPMSWDVARDLEAGGLVSFGPHSVRHPILARLDDDDVAGEIDGSWRRLRTELADPLPVFCYPNGELGDFGEREIAAVQAAGLAAAVRVGGPPVRATDLTDPFERWQLARTPFPRSLAGAVRRANGTDHLRAAVARLRTRRRVPGSPGAVS